MCILFLYYEPARGSGADNKYELILASNRDEFYARPTRPLSVWGPEASAVASGVDLQPGRAGGTWLGASESGRLAALLNIYSDLPPNPNSKGRGFIVPDFLLSRDTMHDYVQRISHDVYEGYHVVLLEKLALGWNIGCHTNKTNYTEYYGPGVYAFSNNLDSSRPFMKAIYGRDLFKNIVETHSISQRGILVDQLMQLLSDDTLCLPQSAADYNSFTLHKYPFYSSVKVVSPAGDYGTRTSSVIMVDSQGYCDFIERTRPDDGGENWLTSNVRLRLKSTPCPDSL